MRGITKREFPAPSSVDREAVAAQITRLTSAHASPLRVKWERLDTSEQAELVALVRQADQPGSFGLAHLGSDRPRFERLAEKGAGQPDFFREHRERAETAAAIAEIGRRAASPPRRVTLEEAGSLTLRREWIFDFVRDGVLYPAHIAALVYVMSVFENGGLPRPSPVVRFDGDAIHVDTARGGLLPDLDGVFLSEKGLLQHLCENRFVEISKAASVWSIRPGSRLRGVKRAGA